MNELESLLQLNKMLLAESPQYLAQAAAFPPDAEAQWRLFRSLVAEAQWRLFRSLVNVRAPRPAGGDFLALQDSLLQKITACKGVTAFHSLTPMQKGLYLWRGDITTLQTDGIVNAANSGLTGCYHPCHQCIDNAIHTFSGVQLRLACASIIKAQGRPEPVIQPVPTLFRLPYGRCSDQSLQALAKLGMQVVQWDVVAESGADNTNIEHARREAHLVASQVKPGSILLFHANLVPKGSAQLLRETVTELRRRGYNFVSVSTLLGMGVPQRTMNGYFTSPGDNKALDSKFGVDGTGRHTPFNGE